MEFKARGIDLLEGFQLAAAIIGTRPPRDLARSARLVGAKKSVVLYAFGEETALVYNVPTIEYGKDGQVALPSETMIGVLRELRDEEVAVKTIQASCELNAGSSHFRVLGEDAAGYPEPMRYDPKAAFSLPAGLLRSMVGRTMFAASPDESRYAMHGILFAPEDGYLEVAATDGRRLAYVKSKVPGAKHGDPVIVPRVSVAHFLRLLPDAEDVEVQIVTSENHGVLIAERGTLFSRLVDGGFPPYRDVIPRDITRKMELPVAPFQAAVRRAALLSDPSSRTVRFHFSGDHLELSSRSADRGEATIKMGIPPVESDFTIHFNPEFVLDCLKVIDGETFSFEFTDEHRQAVMRDRNGLIYVIMPVTPASV